MNEKTIPVGVSNDSAEIVKVLYSAKPLLPTAKINSPFQTFQVHLQTMPEHTEESMAIILISGEYNM